MQTHINNILFMKTTVIPTDLQALLEKIEPNTATCIKMAFEAIAGFVTPKPFLNMKEAMDYLGCQRNTLNYLAKSGQIAYSRPNDSGSGRVYFKRKDLDAWLMRNYHPAQGDIETQAANYIATH